MTLAPNCETETKSYAEAIKGKNYQMLANFDALHADAERRKKAFESRPDWIEEVKTELHKTPGEGFALDGAKITLPRRAVTLAASENCQKCRGQKMVSCDQCRGTGAEQCLHCRGQRQEFCITCGGSGHNPQHHDQTCLMCHGQRMIPCRHCRAQGQTASRMCQGRRGIPCATCRGTGQTSEQIDMTFGATTSFHLKTEDLPSGLRRGLDRLGLPNLTKGHADVDIAVPKEEVEEEMEILDDTHSAPPAQKAPDPTLHYVATLPFADLRVDFGGKKAAVGVFGKRAVFLDVPPFLDESLQPWRVKLAGAAKGRLALHEALEARALREAAGLHLQRKGSVKEFRRLYPVGLSAAAAEDIMRDAHKALKRFTLRMRALAAMGGGILATALFAASYFTSLPLGLAARYPLGKEVLTFVPPLMAGALCWTLMSSAAYLALRKNFSDIKIARRQHPSHTHYVMMAVIALLWLGTLALSPARPAWLAPFSRLLH